MKIISKNVTSFTKLKLMMKNSNKFLKISKFIQKIQYLKF